jgi:hypothetical protein
MQLVDAQRSNVLSVEKIQSVIYSMRTEVEKDLADIKETPQNWLGLISLFIPFIGIVRKWYSDQRRLYLQAQLKNFTLILNIFTNAEMVQKKLEQQMAALKETQQKYLDERRWMK